MDLELDGFISWLRHLDAAAITAAAAELDEAASSAAGEVDWWRATVEIDRLLRARHAGRRAGVAANQAAAAVTAAARAAGMAMPDPRVTAVARAAADVARGLLVNAAAVDDLLRGCRGLAAA
jgi:hypothetical protein